VSKSASKHGCRTMLKPRKLQCNEPERGRRSLLGRKVINGGERWLVGQLEKRWFQ